LKKALLIIDRGSREPEVREELDGISSIAKTKLGGLLKIMYDIALYLQFKRYDINRY
jgi:hypothetical protein